tara:strand:+ start:2193 stop:2978 length:786 start_codon:yes stop_codon:yes gene_type:complete
MIRHGIFFHDETYLVSFPRSGANWLRYCVEVITKQATFGVKPAARGHNALTPLDNSVEFAVKKILNEELIDGTEINQKPILQHSHLWLTGYSSTRIVLLVRNPKEAILRDIRATMIHDKYVKGFIQANPLTVLLTPDGIRDYTNIINRYVDHPGPKHLVYYEDLKNDPEKTLIECTSFLMNTDTTEIVKKFMEDYSYHNERSVKIYNNGAGPGGKSYTGGSAKNTMHSDELLSDSDKKKWDKYIIKNHPKVVPIVERYFEK